MEPAAHDPVPSILLFGLDKSLVKTRTCVLEKAGFHVSPALSTAELCRIAEEKPVDLFLLCDSLDAQARAFALLQTHLRRASARCLVVMPYGCPPEFEPAVEVFSSIEGPAKLVEVIRTLTASARSSIASGLSA